MTMSDISRRGLIASLPMPLRPWAHLIRLDRPVGWLLLLAPCWMAFALAALISPAHATDALYFAALCLPGAILMRGAGCIVNDLWDRDIDARVARTLQRPLVTGEISMHQALAALVGLSALGFLILLEFSWPAILCGVASLPIVALYPLAKRVLHCPQAVLGIAFSWGAPVASFQIFQELPLPMGLLWGGCIIWIIGYDTIYAFQDIADDRHVGVKSFALWLGYSRGRTAVLLMFGLAFCLWATAISVSSANTDASPQHILDGLLLWGSFAAVATWSGWLTLTWRVRSPQDCLRVFKLCPWIGLSLAASWGLKTLLLIF